MIVDVHKPLDIVSLRADPRDDDAVALDACSGSSTIGTPRLAVTPAFQPAR